MHNKWSAMDTVETEVTLVVKRIPSHFDRESVMDWLDAVGYGGSYDFLYVPLRFETGTNRGYMFINFMEAESARRFAKAMDGLRLGHNNPELSVSLSETQGIEGALAKCKKARQIRNPLALPYVRCGTAGAPVEGATGNAARKAAPKPAQGEEAAAVAVKAGAIGGGGGVAGIVRAPPGLWPPPGLEPPGRAAAAPTPPGVFIKGGPPGLWAAGAPCRAAPSPDDGSEESRAHPVDRRAVPRPRQALAHPRPFKAAPSLDNESGELREQALARPHSCLVSELEVKMARSWALPALDV